MVAALKTEPFSDFSDRMMRKQRLPGGAELRLYRSTDQRRVRSDMIVKRRPINPISVPYLGDAATAADLVRVAKDILSTAVEERGLELRLYDHEKSRVNGNTHLDTIRKAASMPTTEGLAFEKFMDIISDAEIDDLTVVQAGRLFSHLGAAIGAKLLEEQLAKAAKRK